MASVSVKHIYDSVSSTTQSQIVDKKQTVSKTGHSGGANVHSADVCPICNRNIIENDIVEKEKIFASDVITDPDRRFISDEFIKLIENVIDNYMSKVVYDSDDDGVVNYSDKAKVAESVDWDNIENRPDFDINGIMNAIHNNHNHANKEAIDLIGIDKTDGEESPLWNGNPWPYPITAESLPKDGRFIRNIIIDSEVPLQYDDGDVWIEYNELNNKITSINVAIEDSKWLSLDSKLLTNEIIDLVVEKISELEVSHNQMEGLQGGEEDQYYHLSEDQYNILNELLDDYLNNRLGSEENQFTEQQYMLLIEIINKYQENKNKELTEDDVNILRNIIKIYQEVDNEMIRDQLAQLIGAITELIQNGGGHGGCDCKQFSDSEKEAILKLLREFGEGDIDKQFTDAELEKLRELIYSQVHLTLEEKISILEIIQKYNNGQLGGNGNDPRLSETDISNIKTVINEYLSGKFNKQFTDQDIINIKTIIREYIAGKFNCKISDQELSSINAIISEYNNGNFNKQLTQQELFTLKNIINAYNNGELSGGNQLTDVEILDIKHVIDEYNEGNLSKQFNNNEETKLRNIISDYNKGNLNKQFTYTEESKLKNIINDYNAGNLTNQFNDNQVALVNEIISDYIKTNKFNNKQFTDDEVDNIRALLYDYINKNLGSGFNDEVRKQVLELIKNYIDGQMSDGQLISNGDYPVLLELLDKYRKGTICECETTEVKEYDGSNATITDDAIDISLDGGVASSTDYDEAENVDGAYSNLENPTGTITPTPGGGINGEDLFTNIQYETLIKIANKYISLGDLPDQYRKNEYQVLLEIIDDYLNDRLAGLTEEQLDQMIAQMSERFESILDELVNTVNQMVSAVNFLLSQAFTENEFKTVKEIITKYNSNEIGITEAKVNELIDEKLKAHHLDPDGPHAGDANNTLTDQEIKDLIDEKIDEKLNGKHILTNEEYSIFMEIINHYKNGEDIVIDYDNGSADLKDEDFSKEIDGNVAEEPKDNNK